MFTSSFSIFEIFSHLFHLFIFSSCILISQPSFFFQLYLLVIKLICLIFLNNCIIHTKISIGSSKQLSSITVFLSRLTMCYLNSSIPLPCWYSLFCFLSFTVLVFLRCLIVFFCSLIFILLGLWASLASSMYLRGIYKPKLWFSPLLNEFKRWGYSLRIQPFPFPIFPVSHYQSP